MSDKLNISFEPHLQETLSHIVILLPSTLSNQLRPYLNVQNPPQTTPTIPYSLLRSISQWSHTLSGLTALKSHDPVLSPHDYTMISLLSGTTTSPERKFPAYIPPDPLAERKREYKDRKTITAVLNALLSIIGSGAATWWAADRTGWRPEWVGAYYFSYTRSRFSSKSFLLIETAIFIESVVIFYGCSCSGNFRNYLVHYLGIAEVGHQATKNASSGC
jgi:TMEM199 family protein